ncbi:DUF2911 domain-containing protein [Flavihumibacter solisilvae]|uniref:Uncharacterized protein n=1 Tax=Flavihumibacter solisilvae TaxID=1349421 RepID=A0A0C1LD09_9BACT|nr:DUF2911 domain-containing protein [Flavihumibacter solisilvae]KIC93398.1 hypothetical protein OI18_16595 [Flavihumibacter solisilvae]
MINRFITATVFLCLGFQFSMAQLTTVPDGGNKRAWVGEQIGLTEVHIRYDRPAVKGRTDAIWGKLVPYGFNDPGFGTSKASPWRAGANENTVISFSTDVTIEGKALQAGEYGFHIAVYEDKCTLIFSKNHTSWGSYFYDPSEDALRVDVKQQTQNDITEFLKYEFTGQTEKSAVINLLWEKWRIPFRIETDLVNLQLASFRRELRGEKSFIPGWQSWVQAAQYCLRHNVNLEEGLKWAETAVTGTFIGESNFITLSTKAALLEKLGQTGEAAKVMQQAIPLGSVEQVHNYGRELMQKNRTSEAVDVFKKNYEKHPDTFITNVGMARALSASGSNKKALPYAEKALNQAPDGNAKKQVETMIQELSKK